MPDGSVPRTAAGGTKRGRAKAARLSASPARGPADARSPVAPVPIPSEADETELADHILRALRRVSRAIDLHSRRLAHDHQLTGPQLVCLRQLSRSSPTTPGRLAQEVSLSHATVTGILGRLESRGLVAREKDTVDRRRVMVTLTDDGRRLIELAPYPLQERFLRALENIPLANRTMIAVVLDQIVDMMGAGDLDASPVLTTGPMLAEPEEVEGLLDAEGQLAPPPGPSARDEEG